MMQISIFIIYLICFMNQELLAKLKKRQIASGMIEEQPVHVQKNVKEVPKSSNFAEKQKMLEAFLGGRAMGAEKETVPVKREEIKGDSQGFMNARKQLERNLGMKAGSNSAAGGPSTNSLPPPPPLNGLPPPPSLDSLPPLPPPPSLDSLPPPPPPSLSSLPPPPPPPSQSQYVPQKSTNPPPPPSQPQYVPQKSTNPPPPPSQPQYVSQKSKNPPPPPSQQRQSVSRSQLRQEVPSSHPNPSQNTHISSPPPKSVKQPKSQAFRQTKGARHPIFGGSQGENISNQFFGKDLAGLIKRQFIRSTDILSIIGTSVPKKHYTFNFPSIEKEVRSIEPSQVLYADGSVLDVVSCYMQRNLNSIQSHKEARLDVINQFKSYNWNSDALNLKVLRERVANLPSIKYREPNLTRIKNGLSRCDNLIKTYVALENFEECAKIKQIRKEIQSLFDRYKECPENNEALIEEMERRIHHIKNISA